MTRTVARAAALTMSAALAMAAVGAAEASQSSGVPKGRPCFIVQSHWNVGLDGPVPVCPLPVHG